MVASAIQKLIVFCVVGLLLCPAAVVLAKPRVGEEAYQDFRITVNPDASPGLRDYGVEQGTNTVEWIDI